MNSKILIVDDNVINRILLTEIVEELGLPYTDCSSGKEAIDLLAAGEYAVVLLDIEMPGMNGFDVVQHVRNKMPPPVSKIPLIAITAHDPHTFWDEYQNSGFDDLISKPYSEEKVRTALKKNGLLK